MQNNHPKPVEDYTDAFLWSFCLMLFMIFFVMTAFIGFLWALFTAFALNRGITYLVRRKNR